MNSIKLMIAGAFVVLLIGALVTSNQIHTVDQIQSRCLVLTIEMSQQEQSEILLENTGALDRSTAPGGREGMRQLIEERRQTCDTAGEISGQLRFVDSLLTLMLTAMAILFGVVIGHSKTFQRIISDE